MKKIVKILLIIAIYVFIFWGMYKIGANLINNLKRSNCTCDTSNTFTTKPLVYNTLTTVNTDILKNEVETKEKEVETKKTTTTKKVTTKKKTTTKKTTTSSVSKTELKNYAHDLVINTYGWSESDYECLVKLWERESNWNPDAHNKKSGAHGIPQSLPASKMKSEGSDYYTNGYTQIRWGLKYIKQRYGTPTSAWSHSQKTGWY